MLLGLYWQVGPTPRHLLTTQEGGEDRGRTALQIALDERRHLVAQLLVQSGADATVTWPEQGLNTIHVAATMASADLINSLALAGVDALARVGSGDDAHYVAGDTALHIAARSRGSSPATVQALVTLGVDKEARNVLAKTAYANARRSQRLIIIQAFEAVGVDTSVVNNDAEFVRGLLKTPHSQPKVKDYLNERKKLVPVVVGSDVYALHHYAQTGDADMVSFLLSFDIDINTVDEQGFTPLMVAVAGGQEHVVSTLLAQQADPNVRAGKSGKGTTALLLALGHNPFGPTTGKREQQTALVKELLKGGADANLSVGDRVPLKEALRLGLTGAQLELLQAGADPKQTNINLRAQLNQFIYRDKLDGVRRLTKLGADLNAFDNNGLTPLMYASYYGRVAVVSHLLEQGADARL